MTTISIQLSKNGTYAIVKGNITDLNHLYKAINFAMLKKDGDILELTHSFAYKIRRAAQKAYSVSTISRQTYDRMTIDTMDLYIPSEHIEEFCSVELFLPTFLVQLKILDNYIQKDKKYCLEYANLIKLLKFLTIEAISAKDEEVGFYVHKWLRANHRFSESYIPLHIQDLSLKYTNFEFPEKRIYELPKILESALEKSKDYRTHKSSIARLCRESNNDYNTITYDWHAVLFDKLEKNLIAI